jgi:regulatory protein RepA
LGRNRDIPRSKGCSALTAKEWLERIEKRGSISKVMSDPHGLFIRINPMLDGGSTDKDVYVFRQCLIEADKGTKEEQLGALRKIGLPITAIINSAGKSIHAWVRIDADDRQEYNTKLSLLHQFCEQSLGLKVDPKNKNPSRYSRMPNGFRMQKDKDGNPVLGSDGKPIINTQRLLAVNVPGKPWNEWHEWVASMDATAPKPLPKFESWDDLEEAELAELKMILEGILNQGAKMTLGGSSKAGKTWLLMDLAFSIATGRDWLGIKTHQGRVLYVNFEIQKQFFRKRGQSIRRAKGIPHNDKLPNLLTWTLRGHLMTAEDFKEEILEQIGDEKLDVIIVDPLYKLLNGADANATGDMQKILAELEQIAERAGAALVYADHFSKGNQAAKKAIDRISGSGVTARDPDAILTFTEHKDEGCLILEFTLRNFKPVKSIVVSKVNNSCIFERRPELNTHDFAKPGAHKQFTAHQLLKRLPIDGMDGNAWYTIVEENTGMSRPAYKNLRTELKEREDIELIKREGKQIWVKTQSCLDREKCITIADDDLDNDDDLSPEDLAKLESELEDDPFE